MPETDNAAIAATNFLIQVDTGDLIHSLNACK